MTNEEIKKSLEYCVGVEGSEGCRKCPYLFNNDGCNDTLCKDTLNLITEQEQEIARLKDEFKQLETNAEILARGVRDLNHENYELTEKIKQTRKETAKEILQEWADDNSSMGLDNTSVKNIAKKYGVEVEE